MSDFYRLFSRVLKRRALGVGALLVCAFALVFIFAASPNFRGFAQSGEGLPAGDYLQFYLAGRMVLGGYSDRLYDFALQTALQRDPAFMPVSWENNSFMLFIYPPFVSVVCALFAMLPFFTGAALLVILMAACFGLALLLLLLEYPELRPYWGAFLLAGLVYRPLVESVYSCQNATFSLLLFTATFLLLKHNKAFLAGLAAAGLSFKPQLVVLVFLIGLVLGNRRFISGLFTGAALCAAVSLAVSVQSTFDYIQRLPNLGRWIEMPGMQLARMSCLHGFFRLLMDGAPPLAVQFATAAASIPVILLVARSVRILGFQHEMSWCMVVIGSVLVSPHLLFYDLTILVLPFMLLLAAGDARLKITVAMLYLVALISPVVAGLTHVQLIVPLMFWSLLEIAKGAERSRLDKVSAV